MRIDRLYLKEFRNLQNFSVDFEEGSPRTVLIGRNGVGKTNILEAITSIFKQLDLRERPTFEYKINYICAEKYVEVTSTVDATSDSDLLKYQLRFRVSDRLLDDSNEFISEAAFYKLNNESRLLPKHVFGYYSGTSSRLRDLFKQHTENYRDDLINGREDTIRPLFLAEDWHSQFVLLSFYSKEDEEIATFLRNQLGITALESVLFVLNQPHWYKKDPSSVVKQRGDGRYWWAAGTVKHLLGDLHREALAPMRTSERISVGIKQHRTKEHSYLYLDSNDSLRRLAATIDQKELFKRLESTVLSDLLREVKIRFQIEGSESSLTFSDLSEGEQQLLTVLGLLRFTNQDESLFLLDEPDTHLNPAWCLDYLDILTKYGGGLSKSQIIMTTHSPLVFAGLEKEEVIILQKGDFGVVAENPATSPKGMGFSAILTSEFFGLRSSLDRATLELLDEKRRLGTLQNRSRLQEDRLLELNKLIRGADFSTTVRDPLYAEFVNAMTEAGKRNPELNNAVLTAEDIEARRKHASEAISKISQDKK